MTLFDPKSIQVLGADSNNNNVILCTMYVDNIADLPAQNAFTGNVLSMGCRAIVINDNSVHRLNSAGQWVQIIAGNSTYTRAEIDSMIARIDAKEAEDRAALVAQVDGGAKNIFKNTAVSKTYHGVTFTVNEDGTVTLSGTAVSVVGVLEIGTVTPPAGSYIVSGCPAGGSWAPSTNKYRIRVAKNGVWLGDETGTGYTVAVNGSDVINLQINSGVGVDTAGLVFKPMICTAADYAISPAFVPYAPTNRELYNMIRGYHP